MAKGHLRNDGYKPGNNWDVCDRCGFERRVSELAEEWTGLTVCTDGCLENRHPQDFLRVREEKIVPDAPGTPEDESNDVSPTYLAATSTVPDGDFNDNNETL